MARFYLRKMHASPFTFSGQSRVYHFPEHRSQTRHSSPPSIFLAPLASCTTAISLAHPNSLLPSLPSQSASTYPDSHPHLHPAASAHEPYIPTRAPSILPMAKADSHPQVPWLVISSLESSNRRVLAVNEACGIKSQAPRAVHPLENRSLLYFEVYMAEVYNSVFDI